MCAFFSVREQLKRSKPYFPLSHGVARVDDRSAVSRIVFVIKNGLRWPRKIRSPRRLHRFVWIALLGRIASTGCKGDKTLHKKRHKIFYCVDES